MFSPRQDSNCHHVLYRLLYYSLCFLFFSRLTASSVTLTFSTRTVIKSQEARRVLPFFPPTCRDTRTTQLVHSVSTELSWCQTTPRRELKRGCELLYGVSVFTLDSGRTWRHAPPFFSYRKMAVLARKYTITSRAQALTVGHLIFEFSGILRIFRLNCTGKWQSLNVYPSIYVNICLFLSVLVVLMAACTAWRV